MFIVNLLFLSLASFSTYCVFTHSYFYECSNMIGLFCCMDFVLHVTNINKMRPSMILHHLFAISISVFTYNHIDAMTLSYTNNECVSMTMIKNVMSVEISTIFLMNYYLMKHMTSKIYLIHNLLYIMSQLNQVAFVSTFAYYRLYNYFVNVVMSRQIYVFISSVSKNDYYTYSGFIGLYGLFFLNCFWFYEIVQKIVLNTPKRKIAE